MRLNNNDLREAYRRFNKVYFNDSLPKKLSVQFVPSSELDGDWGEENDDGIVINEKLQTVPDFAFIVLLHEMAHVKAPQNSHGHRWSGVIDSLYRMGAYDELL
jgi:predicted metal-dependent hydrolase